MTDYDQLISLVRRMRKLQRGINRAPDQSSRIAIYMHLNEAEDAVDAWLREHDAREEVRAKDLTALRDAIESSTDTMPYEEFRQTIESAARENSEWPAECIVRAVEAESRQARKETGECH